jgi:Kef-type K+ transport system membrane component KefB
MDNPYSIAAVWIGLAFIAALIAIRTGVSVSLVEIIVGIFVGNLFDVSSREWIDFLAGFGSGLLTFLAGAELEPDVLKSKLSQVLTMGVIAFFLPFGGALLFAYYAAGWNFEAAEIAAIALSTTSVAVVYAVMLETGFNETPLGKVILAACFVNDLGTVLALAILFVNVTWYLPLFIVALLVILPLAPRMVDWVVRYAGGRISEPEVKFVFLIIFGLGGLAAAGGSEAILPAYLAGMILAGTFLRERTLVLRMRTTAFSILTPFYFIRAGTFVKASAIVSGWWLIAAFLVVKMITKFIGVRPVTAYYRFPQREAMYTTLLMSTGLTFGTISALFGLTHGVITSDQYAILVTVVILSAFVPTLIAQQFFRPSLEEHMTPATAPSLTAEAIAPSSNGASPAGSEAAGPRPAKARQEES